MKYTYIIILFLLVTKNLMAEPCFDFEKSSDIALKPIPSSSNLFATDVILFGERPGAEKTNWAQVVGQVPFPIQKIYELLLGHDITKSPSAETVVSKKINKNFDEFHEVEFKVKPFLFITVEWIESWAYKKLNEDKGFFKRALISYQKISGTSHIKHLCGNIELLYISDRSSLVYLYEEVRATNRSSKETADGLLGTLKTIRSIKQ